MLDLPSPDQQRAEYKRLRRIFGIEGKSRVTVLFEKPKRDILHVASKDFDLRADETTIKIIMSEVCAATGVTKDELLSNRRLQPASRARILGYWAFIQFTELSYPAVGRLFYRDHTTVLHGARRVFNYPGVSKILRCGESREAIIKAVWGVIRP